MTRISTELIREGGYFAEVTIELIDDESGWSPYIAERDVEKLDRVRLALRTQDLKSALREAKVSELTPILVAPSSFPVKEK